MVERHCRLATRIATALKAEPGLHVLNDVVLNQIILACGEGEAGDRATMAVIRKLQEDGILFAGGARWRDRWVLRLSVISGPMDDAEADKSVDAIRNAWRSVRQSDAAVD